MSQGSKSSDGRSTLGSSKLELLFRRDLDQPTTSGAEVSDFSGSELFSASPFESFSVCSAVLSSSCQLGIEIGLIGGFDGNRDLAKETKPFVNKMLAQR